VNDGTGFARFYGGGSFAVNVDGAENMVGLYYNNTATLTLADGGGSLVISTNGGDGLNNQDGSFFQGFLCSAFNSTTGPGASVVINALVAGPGGIEQESYGSLHLNNHNTYSGGTELTGGQKTYYQFGDSFGTGHIVINGGGQSLINDSGTALTVANPITFITAGQSLKLANVSGSSTVFNGVSTLVIGGNGINNEFTGDATGSVVFDGAFNFDLTGADNTQGNQWQIIDTANLNSTYGDNFSVAGFTQDGNLWKNGIYQYDESLGNLAVVPVPEPSTIALGLMGGLAFLGVSARRRFKK
jgi:hypothetical protein